MTFSKSSLRALSLLSVLLLAGVLGASSTLLGMCGPFTDVAADNFCSFVLEIFYFGITTGVTPTTYDPTGNVSRLQMSAFLSRTVDGVLRRGSRKAVTEKYWTPQNESVLSLTTVGSGPVMVKYDGADLWVSNPNSSSVSRVRAGDGRLLETWTGASGAFGVLSAMGRILVTGPAMGVPGKLYSIDPRQILVGSVTTVASNLAESPYGIAFDGAHVWTANASGSVSIVTPAAAPPWPVATILTGFMRPVAAVYDGSNVWIADQDAGTLLRLNPAGAILQTVTVGFGVVFPAFDGTNLWAPAPGRVTIVRASTGSVLTTLTDNGIAGGSPLSGAFDGERMLIVNLAGSVSLWKAASLTPIGEVSVGGISVQPVFAASDGANFWITLNLADKLARF